MERTAEHQVGTGTVSVAAEVAEVQKVLKASGLRYTMHSAGTVVGAYASCPRTVVSLGYLPILFQLVSMY